MTRVSSGAAEIYAVVAASEAMRRASVAKDVDSSPTWRPRQELLWGVGDGLVTYRRSIHTGFLDTRGNEGPCEVCEETDFRCAGRRVHETSDCHTRSGNCSLTRRASVKQEHLNESMSWTTNMLEYNMSDQARKDDP